MTFEEYLSGKKIDLKAFEQAEKEAVINWRQEFEQMHPKSFTAQKLFLINGIRRRFPLKIEHVQETNEVKPEQAASPVKPKPVMRPKIK